MNSRPECVFLDDVGAPRLRYCFEEECADYDEVRQLLEDVKGTNDSLVRGGGRGSGGGVLFCLLALVF